MPRPRVVIAGASGFVGRALTAAFADDGYDVATVGRSGTAVWGDAAAIEGLVDCLLYTSPSPRD